MAIDVILGLQWGDEGKGKIVDYFSDQYDIIARFQGGPNAGHTLVINKQKYVLHTIPSGIFREDKDNVIGNGVVIDPITLEREINGLKATGLTLKNLMVARKAHMILPSHRFLDAGSEASKGKAKIGSTLKGIGPTYMDKTGRNGLRVGDLFRPDFKEKYEALKAKHIGISKQYPEVEFNLEEEEKKWFASLEALKSLKIIDCSYYVNEALKSGKQILAEGAQGSMLDIDFGTYPYVTSSNTMTAGVCIGLGVSPHKIRDVIGITKAYCTRVGSGPFPTELEDEVGEKLRTVGKEFGATTGRPRRCGWIDIPQLKYTIMINGVTKICLTKLDILNDFDEIAVCHEYSIGGKPTMEVPFDMDIDGLKMNYQSIIGWKSDLCDVQDYGKLPEQAVEYINHVEKLLEVPISYISTGPAREALIIR